MIIRCSLKMACNSNMADRGIWDYLVIVTHMRETCDLIMLKVILAVIVQSHFGVILFIYGVGDMLTLDER